MPAARKYRRRVPFTLNTEADILNEFIEQCRKDGQTVSERFTEFMTQELQKNEIGQVNPIQVTYHANSTAKRSDTTTLDYYIEKGLVTKEYFREELKGKPIEHVQRVSALGRTIHESAETVISFVKTGKYTIH